MNMAFSKTTEQIRNRTKTVTRRSIDTWRKLKPGDVLQAVAKAQGLKKGEHVERLATIRVVRINQCLLCELSTQDVAREGFRGMTPEQFIFDVYRANPATLVRRIEFEYVDEAPE